MLLIIIWINEQQCHLSKNLAICDKTPKHAFNTYANKCYLYSFYSIDWVREDWLPGTSCFNNDHYYRMIKISYCTLPTAKPINNLCRQIFDRTGTLNKNIFGVSSTTKKTSKRQNQPSVRRSKLERKRRDWLEQCLEVFLPVGIDSLTPSSLTGFL